MKSTAPRLAMILPLLAILVIGCAILLIDRFVVRPLSADEPTGARKLAELHSFVEVPEASRRELAQELLADFAPLVDTAESRVVNMLRRESSSGTVWALELEHPATTKLLRPGAGSSTMEFEQLVLQPLIVVEASSAVVDDTAEMPLWFGFRAGSGAGPWAEQLEASALESPGLVTPRVDETSSGVLSRSEQAGGHAFVAVSREPEAMAQRLDETVVQRMASWPDVLFVGSGRRLAAVWPEPAASLAYWAARSTSDALVPSITSSGFEWDLQRAVDIANLLFRLPQAEQIERVVELEIVVPEIELPELDLAPRLEEIRRDVQRRNEETLREFERDLEELREESSRRQAEIRARLRQRLQDARRVPLHGEGGEPPLDPLDEEPPDEQSPPLEPEPPD